MANHLTLGIYRNGEYKYNVVREEDLQHHIEYNKKFRFGRLLYVDGKRVYNGDIHTNVTLDKYDKIAEVFFKNNRVDMNTPTIPYR